MGVTTTSEWLVNIIRVLYHFQFSISKSEIPNKLTVPTELATGSFYLLSLYWISSSWYKKNIRPGQTNFWLRPWTRLPLQMRRSSSIRRTFEISDRFQLSNWTYFAKVLIDFNNITYNLKLYRFN